MTIAVGRALAIFDAFDEGNTILTLQAITDRIGAPKATTFRLLNTFVEEGFLVRHPDNSYSLSLKVVRLAGLVPHYASVREIARPVMQEVAAACGETITLNTRFGLERVCLEAVDTPAPLMTIARPGDRVSLTRGATSRVLLAFLQEDERDRLLRELFPDNDERAVVTEEIDRFRAQGYGVTHAQRVPGITAVAAPLFDSRGRAEHCLALTGPAVRVDPREGELIDLVRRGSREITRRLGGRVGASPAVSAGIEAKPKGGKAG